MARMSDIAAHLGLSRLTVSAVLNNRTEQVGISQETAARVRAAAAELGYHRNHLAVAMKTGRNRVIGCILSRLQAEWMTRTLSGVLQWSHQSQYLIKIEEVYGLESEKAVLARLIQQRVAGIFCCNLNSEIAFVKILRKTSEQYAVPVVCSFSRKDLAARWVDSDDRQGIFSAVRHLWDLGHRRLAFIAGMSLEKVRSNAFLDAMAELGSPVPEDFMIWTDWRLDKAAEAAHALLKKGRRRPTAILCANDKIAAIVIREARSLGFEVPRDLSVIGFSNSQVCDLLDPPLTSVAQAFEEIGRRCGEVLEEMIEQQWEKKLDGHRKRELIPTWLEVRQSTAEAPRRSKE